MTPSEISPRKTPWGQIVIYTFVIALLGLVAYQMQRNGPLAAGPVGAGQIAPVFELTAFDGHTYQLADLRGRVVVINFWASWCIPCEQEAEFLENAWQHYQERDVLFIGIDYVDTETEAKAFMRRFNVSYPNGPDLGTRISQAYRIKGVPETYIIDSKGTLASVKIGPFESQAEIESLIEPLLTE